MGRVEGGCFSFASPAVPSIVSKWWQKFHPSFTFYNCSQLCHWKDSQSHFQPLCMSNFYSHIGHFATVKLNLRLKWVFPCCINSLYHMLHSSNHVAPHSFSWGQSGLHRDNLWPPIIVL